MHPARLISDDLLADCTVQRGRRGGPGGQHRNKVETAVLIEHTPSGVRGEASERRSQGQNHRIALFRLRVNLALEVRSAPAVDGGSSDLWSARCAGGRISVSPQHEDFPALLAEALDALSLHGNDIAPAAQRLGVTNSQLIKLLKLEPRALEQVNRSREAASLHRLH